MIGELINKFENMATNTVADFNEVFKDNMLTYPLHYEVEIGDIFNGVRQLKINGEIIHHDLQPPGGFFNKTQKPSKNGKRIKIFYADSTSIGEFPSILEATRKMGIGYNSFYNYIKIGKIKMEYIK